MIYGLNFNGTEIPSMYRARFSERKRIHECAVCGNQTLEPKSDETECNPGVAHTYAPYRPKGETGMAHLSGIATTRADGASMIQQASNGHRLVLVVKRRMALYTVHADRWVSDVFGIYTY